MNSEINNRLEKQGAVFFGIVISFSIIYASGYLGSAKNVLLPLFAVVCIIRIVLQKTKAPLAAWQFFCLFLFVINVIMVALLSDYGSMWLFQSIITLMIVAYITLTPDYEAYRNSKIERIIYLVLMVSLLLLLINSVLNGSAPFIADKDKNYTALIVFIFGCYSYKTKRIFGCIISIVAIYYSNSRACQFAVILFLAFIIIKRILSRKKGMEFDKGVPLSAKIVSIILFSTAIIIIPFSYFWVNVISANGYGLYQTTLVDSSNQIRMNSNIYAFELMCNDPEFLIRGFGDSTLQKLGISVDASTYADSTQYRGLRIVQPHNSVLNEILRNGLIITTLYTIILSMLISRLFTAQNTLYIVPYIFISLFMHSLYIQGFLLLWVILLNAQTEREWHVLT